ncbi:hypothetical protein SVIO_109310 [Streptomyces violaceusniger]|uniref:Uncharacterized protein n=1 Tax=Streptomyces violaceusniger TaxID=68280 RepID=A0A4D4LPC7_STRVO|nr:hypothetical protein SVIO_109310 [Streptomyces violaceusniger]
MLGAAACFADVVEVVQEPGPGVDFEEEFGQVHGGNAGVDRFARVLEAGRFGELEAGED